MARLNIEEDSSEYYPPRARWYRGFFSFGYKFRRALHLEQLYLPAGFSFQQMALSLLLPGYAFFANGRQIIGWTFVCVYVAAAILFVVALGYQLGSLGYGLMISAHATSIVFLEGFWLREYCQFGIRLALAIVTLLAVWLVIYSPMTGFAERHLIMPLRIRGDVVIVQRLTPPRHIQRGDWIMYSLQEHSAGNAHREGGAVWLQAGFGWGPVLAAGGDRVTFSTNGFFVNGQEIVRLPHMPSSGELVVPQNHWFVWPELAISGHGNASEATLSAVMLQLATVSEVEYVGKPFKRWFGRKQIIYEPIHKS